MNANSVIASNSIVEWAGGAGSRTLDCENASGRDFRDRQYGRRVEADRSWTVYHVFSGIPAHVDGAFMIGLTRDDATQSMLSLNLCNTRRQREWSVERPFPRAPSQTQARCS
jgi:hypothetical protein